MTESAMMDSAAGLDLEERAQKTRELRLRLQALTLELECHPAVGGHPAVDGLEALNHGAFDDATLRRFLVARKWVVQKAFEMYLRYAEYRMRVPEGSIAAEEVAVGIGHKKTFLVPKVDRDGEPVFVSAIRRVPLHPLPTADAISLLFLLLNLPTCCLEDDDHVQAHRS